MPTDKRVGERYIAEQAAIDICYTDLRILRGEMRRLSDAADIAKYSSRIVAGI